MLCLIAMDPPSNLDADAIRDEKVKVLKALKPFTGACLGREFRYSAIILMGMEFPESANEADDSYDAFMRTEEFFDKLPRNSLAISCQQPTAR